MSMQQDEEVTKETTQSSDTFPLVGVSLTFLERLVRKRDQNGGRTLKGLSSAQVIAKLILPKTIESRCSFADLVGRNDETQVGLPTHFVCFSWDSPFSALVAALGNQFGGMEKQNIFLWLDMFSLDLPRHRELLRDASLRARWYQIDLWKGIRTIGRFLLVSDPWDEPFVLRQTCCLWEMLATLRISPNGEEWQDSGGSDDTRIPVSVCMAPKQRQEFLIEIGDFQTVEKMMSRICNVDVEHSTANQQNDEFHSPKYVKAMFSQWDGWPKRPNRFIREIMGSFLSRQTMAQLKYMQDRMDRGEPTLIRRQFGKQCRLMKHMINQFVELGLAHFAVNLSSWVFSSNRTKHGQEAYIDNALWAILERLTDLLIDLHRFDDAITVSEEARKIAADPEMVSITLSQLALAKSKCKLFDEAEKLYSEALKLDRIYFSNSTTLATSLTNLGHLLVERQDINSAIKLFQEALDLNLTLRGIDDDTLLRDMHYLGKLYMRMSQFDTALSLFKKAVIMRGYSLECTDKAKKARCESRDCDLAAVLSAICWCQLKLKSELDEASEYGCEVIILHVAIFGEVHFEVSNDTLLMSMIERERGNTQKSDQLETMAHAIAMKSWQHSIANVHEQLYKYCLKSNLAKLRSLLDQDRQLQTRTKRDILNESDAFYECAMLMFAVGQPKSTTTMMKACKLRLEAIGPNDSIPELLEVVQLAIEQGTEADREAAVPFVHLLGEVVRKKFPDDREKNELVIELKGKLGAALLAQGSIVLAGKLVIPALKGISVLLGDKNPKTIELMRTTAALFVAEGDADKSVALLRHAIDCVQEVNGVDSGYLTLIQNELVDALMHKAQTHLRLQSQLGQNGRESTAEQFQEIADLAQAAASTASEAKEVCVSVICALLKELYMVVTEGDGVGTKSQNELSKHKQSIEGAEPSTKGAEASTQAMRSAASTQGVESSTQGAESSTQGVESSTQGAESSTQGVEISTQSLDAAVSANEIDATNAQDQEVWWNTIATLLEQIDSTFHEAEASRLANLANWYSNLAVALRFNADYESADGCLRKALTIEMKVHGSDHPEVAQTASLLERNFVELEAEMMDSDYDSEDDDGSSSEDSTESSDEYSDSSRTTSSESSIDEESEDSYPDEETSADLQGAPEIGQPKGANYNSSKHRLGKRHASSNLMPASEMIRQESFRDGGLLHGFQGRDKPLHKLLRQMSQGYESVQEHDTKGPSLVNLVETSDDIAAGANMLSSVSLSPESSTAKPATMMRQLSDMEVVTDSPQEVSVSIDASKPRMMMRQLSDNEVTSNSPQEAFVSIDASKPRLMMRQLSDNEVNSPSSPQEASVSIDASKPRMMMRQLSDNEVTSSSPQEAFVSIDASKPRLMMRQLSDNEVNSPSSPQEASVSIDASKPRMMMRQLSDNEVTSSSPQEASVSIDASKPRMMMRQLSDNEVTSSSPQEASVSIDASKPRMMMRQLSDNEVATDSPQEASVSIDASKPQMMMRQLSDMEVTSNSPQEASASIDASKPRMMMRQLSDNEVGHGPQQVPANVSGETLLMHQPITTLDESTAKTVASKTNFNDVLNGKPIHDAANTVAAEVLPIDTHETSSLLAEQLSEHGKLVKDKLHASEGKSIDTSPKNSIAKKSGGTVERTVTPPTQHHIDDGANSVDQEAQVTPQVKQTNKRVAIEPVMEPPTERLPNDEVHGCKCCVIS